MGKLTKRRGPDPSPEGRKQAVFGRISPDAHKQLRKILSAHDDKKTWTRSRYIRVAVEEAIERDSAALDRDGRAEHAAVFGGPLPI